MCAASDNDVYEVKESNFSNNRGQSLFYQSWIPTQNIKFAMMFLHGIGDHSTRESHIFKALAESNIAVYAFDHHGHGKSEGLRGACSSFKDYVDDANAFATLMHEQLRERNIEKFVIMGASFGGLLATHCVLSKVHPWDALILVAPAIGVQLTAVLRVQKVFASVLSTLIPNAKIVPAVRPEDMAKDPAIVKEYVEDPLVIVGNLRSRVGEQILRGMQELEGRREDITVPLLILHGSDDKCTDINMAKVFFENVKSEKKQFEEIEGGYHLIFHENGDFAVEKIRDFLGQI